MATATAPATPTRPAKPPEPRAPAQSRILAKNLNALRVLEDVRAAFAARGVDLLYLKGAAFLDTLYPDLGARHMGDLDVLVRRADQPLARFILRDLGFRAAPPPRGRERSFAHHYNQPFTSPTGVTLELHTDLCQTGRYPIDHDGLWARRIVRTAAGRPIPTLSPEDALLHAAIHEAKHWYAVPEQQREDVVRLIRTWRPHWPTAIARARAWHIPTQLWLTLREAARRGAPVQPAILAVLRPSAPRRLLLAAARATYDDTLPQYSPRRRLPQLAILLSGDAAPRHLARFATTYAARRLGDLAWLQAGRAFRDVEDAQ